LGNEQCTTYQNTHQRTWNMIVATNGLIFIYTITQEPRGNSLMLNGNCCMHEFLMLTQYEVIDMLNFKCNSNGNTYFHGLTTNFAQVQASILNVQQTQNLNFYLE
jgi:hypothetical protein